MAKEKAPMNRTITIDDGEINELKLKVQYHYRMPNEIICGDFNEINNSLPENSVDLILLDPPYNITKKYDQEVFKSMSDDDYYNYIKDIIFKCLIKLKPTGTMYVCGDWKTSYIQRKALEYFENLGECDVVNRITWSRDKGRGSEKNWKNNIEDIWMVVKDKNSYYFDVNAVKMRKTVLAPYKDKDGNNKDWHDDGDGAYRMTSPSNVWFDITVPFWSMTENTEHPTQKSEKLYAKLILASSKEGDLVYEPFAGVCTGSVTANKLGRNFIAVEKSQKYACLGYKRLMMAEVNPHIQGYEDGIFRDK